MKVIKDLEPGLLFSPFGIGGKWHLQAAVLLFFGFDNPDMPLPEQEMWPCILPLLGSAPLDAGFPKPCGEFLVAGSCRAAHGAQTKASRVAVRVGNLVRELLVFGNRYWVQTTGGFVPSEPEPFNAVPLDWEHAFGGKPCPANPSGKGATDVTEPWGETRRPLPNVEGVGATMGHPDDTPAPACFLPRPADAPERLALAGTYDDNWLATAWPGFPADVNGRYFSMASPEQQLQDSFFEGGEPVVVLGMHPDHQRQETRLPRKRVRLFATRTPNPRKPDEELFEELPTRLETVWLFPDVERGVALYRAVTPTVDEDYEDLIRLFVAVEDQSAAPRSAASWYEEEQRRHKQSVQVDLAPLERAKAIVDKLARTFRTAEQDLEQQIDAALGRAPVVPASIEARAAAANRHIDQALELVDASKARLADAKSKWGHRIKLDPRSLDAARGRILGMRAALQEATARLSDARAELDAERRETAARLNAGPPETVALMRAELTANGIDPDTLEPIPGPGGQWSRAALELVAEGQACLEADPEAQKLLADLGLRPADLMRSHLGLLPGACERDPAAWGLTPGDLPPSWNGKLRLGDGLSGPLLLVPWFEGDRCVRLALRPLKRTGAHEETLQAKAHDASKIGRSVVIGTKAENILPFVRPCEERIVPGSSSGVQALGAKADRPILLTDDPPMAWLLYAEVGDVYCILIATGPDAALPDSLADLRKAPLALLPLPPDAPPDAIEPWQTLLPDLRPHLWTTEHPWLNTAEARAAQAAVRPWLLAPLPSGLPVPNEAKLEAETNEHGIVSLSVHVPVPDIEAMQQRLDARIRSGVRDAMPPLEFKGIEQIATERERLQKMGLLTPEHDRTLTDGIRRLKEARSLLQQVANGTTEAPRQNFAELADRLKQTSPVDVLAELDRTRSDLQQRGLLYPQADKALANLRAQFAAAFPQFEALQADTLTRLKRLCNLREGALPDWAASIPGAERALKPIPATRAAFLEHVKAGKPLAGYDFSGADLSGLDLSGIDFSRAVLNNVNFRNTVLDKCLFDQTIAEKADFSGASFKNALIKQNMLGKTVWEGSDLEGTSMLLTTCMNSRWQDARLHGARFDKVSLLGTDFSGAFEGAVFQLCSFQNCTVHDAAFTDSSLRLCSWLQSELHGVSFTACDFERTGFTMCTADSVDFLYCPMSNARFIQCGPCNKLRFRECDLRASSFRESVMPEVIFDICRLDGASLEYCDFSRGSLAFCAAPKANLRRCNFEGADLTNMHLSGASLRKSRLVDADLSESNLRQADLYKAVLGHTRFNNTVLRQTLLEGAHAILKQEEMTR